jgi:hypothetical protein
LDFHRDRQGFRFRALAAGREFPDRLVHLADAGRGGRDVIELGELVPPVRAELLGQCPVHVRHRHRRRGLLELGQRLPVRPGHLVRHRRLEHRQRLAELHRTALELPEHAEQLLGGALLDVGGDDVAGDAHGPLAEAERRPPGEAERERGQPGGPGCRSARYVAHQIIVTDAAAFNRPSCRM